MLTSAENILLMRPWKKNFFSLFLKDDLNNTEKHLKSIKEWWLMNFGDYYTWCGITMCWLCFEVNFFFALDIGLPLSDEWWVFLAMGFLFLFFLGPLVSSHECLVMCGTKRKILGIVLEGSYY